MTRLLEVLSESFTLMFQEPKIFVPRLLSSALSSVWLLAVISERLNLLQTAATIPIIGFTGVFVSVMVASMVKNRGSNKILTDSFFDTAKRWKTLFSAAMFFVAAGFVLSIPLSVSLYAYLTTGNLPVLVFGAAVSVLVLMLLGFASYFLPISLYEKKGFLDGFKDSFSMSRSNPVEVSALTVFSFLMLGLAAFTGNALQVFGAIGFIIGRLVSSVVSTYFFVVSPKYYLG